MVVWRETQYIQSKKITALTEFVLCDKNGGETSEPANFARGSTFGEEARFSFSSQSLDHGP